MPCSILICFLTLLVTASATFSDSDVQDGFKRGMPKEIRGLWAGEEKYFEEGVMYPYCSQALWDPRRRYLTWMSAEGTCEDAGVDQVTGITTGDWLKKLYLPESYILRVQQMKCLPMDLCDDDVTRDHDDGDVKFNGWNVEAKSCGVQLKEDKNNLGSYSCEVYQINLLSQPDNRTGEKEKMVVSTLTYSFFENGYDNYVCPEKPTYKADAITADKHAVGSARFVLQQGFDPEFDQKDPCNWDCFEDTKGVCK